MFKRGAGILLPISALWSEGGIGTLGEAAYRFVDRLAEAGQKYWQVLPNGPVGESGSPYQPDCALAGNPFYIDLHRLHRVGLLRKNEMPVSDGRFVNYSQICRERPRLLKEAYTRFRRSDSMDEFCRENVEWLDGYALFYALKKRFHGADFRSWPEQVLHRDKQALERLSEELDEDIRFCKFCQYAFFTDWYALRRYANEAGVKIIGDMPIYVSPDGADVWLHPEQFEVDASLNLTKVAGVPPDEFCKDGQRWGNPLYNWEVMESDSFGWWRRRMEQASVMYDAVRVDHFIGFARYYSIPAESKDARSGRWRRGPGIRLTRALDEVRGDTDLLAENLGIMHPTVERLLERTGYYGMNVMQFGFDGSTDNRHLPHNAQKKTAVYISTHDSDTAMGWIGKCPPDEQKYVADYVGARTRNQMHDCLLRAVYAQVSDLAILQMQDVLGLGSSARMNTPGTATGNWRWRMAQHEFSDLVAQKLRGLATLYGR